MKRASLLALASGVAVLVLLAAPARAQLEPLPAPEPGTNPATPSTPPGPSPSDASAAPPADPSDPLAPAPAPSDASPQASAPTPVPPPPSPSPPPPVPPPPSPSPPPPPPPSDEPAAFPAEEEAEPEPTISEGKLLVLAYNTGFQWSLSPGVIFASGRAGFALGARFGYGFETGPVILVPGVQLNAYFLDPNVYVAMPIMKVVLPIDRFAPFLEGGAGVGHVSDPATTGLALLGGGGFMVHTSASFAFGAEASYQAIVDTGFRGFSVGPILAIAF